MLQDSTYTPSNVRLINSGPKLEDDLERIEIGARRRNTHFQLRNVYNMSAIASLSMPAVPGAVEACP